MSEIARRLTRDGVVSPSASKEKAARKSSKWNSVMIKRILSNPTYAGDLTQGFEKRVSYKSKKRIKTSAENRITVASTHEAIIEKEEFTQAAKRLEKYKRL